MYKNPHIIDTMTRMADQENFDRFENTQPGACTIKLLVL